MSHLVAGQRIESSSEISITPEGGAATNCAHQAFFAADANTAEAVRLRLPDGQILSSHVLCLSYLDTASGKNVTIANLESSIGLLLLPGNNRIIYTNALVG